MYMYFGAAAKSLNAPTVDIDRQRNHDDQEPDAPDDSSDGEGAS